jgi:hypothetical protein
MTPIKKYLPSILALIAFVAVQSTVSAGEPFSGTFTYSARGGQGNANAWSNARYAYANASSSGYGSQYGFGLGAARSGDGRYARAVSESGTPTDHDRRQVLLGQIRVELQDLQVQIRNLQRGLGTYQPVYQQRVALMWVHVGWNYTGGPHYELRWVAVR